MITSWTITGGFIQGDVAIALERSKVYADYVEFNITGYSEKWSKYDISFEYRKDPRDEWKNDSSIIFAQSDYISGNKIFGLDASINGEIRSFKWKYVDNAVFYGELPEVRVNVLPRVRSFSTANSGHIVSEAFSDSKADVITYSPNYRIMGSNNQGNYICTSMPNQDTLEIRNKSDFSIISSYNDVSKPEYVLQIFSGRYIIADTLNNRVIEMDEGLTTILKTYIIGLPSFVDYSEENESILITSRDTGYIYEFTWSDLTYLRFLWQSYVVLDNPSCATYAEDDAMIIVAASTDDNKIAVFDKTLGTTQLINGADLGQSESLSFYKPFRVYRLNDGTICVIEKQGRRIDFSAAESSSSSSSSIGFSSSSSSSESSSSSSSSSSVSSSSSSSSLND